MEGRQKRYLSLLYGKKGEEMKKYIWDVIIGVTVAVTLEIIFGPVHPVIAFFLGFTCTITSIHFRGTIR